MGEAQGLDLNKLRDTIKASVRQSVIDELAPAVDKCLGPVKRTMEEIVRTTVKTELPLAVYKSFEPVGQLVTETVKTSVENTWASLFYGDDFPKADSKEAKDAPKKPKVTFNAAMKKAITDQHRDESRQKNVILYKVTEDDETSVENRKKADEEIVEELLERLEVPYNPVEIVRLGNYDKDSDKVRPIKLVFENATAQSEVMSNTSKLRGASEKLNKISVQYDMSREERDQCREQVIRAKQLTKNSTTHYYRVVGRPGNMSVKDYRKTK